METQAKTLGRTQVPTPRSICERSEYCAAGQMSTAGWLPQPESLLSAEVFGQSYLMAVLARRVSEREVIEPRPWESGDNTINYCREGATFEIVNGLGWTEERTLEIRASTGQYYTSRPDGSWSPMQQWSESFFDPEWQSLPPDNEVHLLIVIINQPTDNMILRRRIALVPDESGELVLSGQYTLSGDNVSIDEFRGP